MSVWGAAPKTDRAQLGRDAWGLLHATADTLTSEPKQIEEFKVLVKNTIDLYPCSLCKTNVRNFCAKVLSELDFLETKAAQSSPRTAARAWVARLHACVTMHLLKAKHHGDNTVVVSPVSARLAAALQGVSDDAAIIQIINSN